MACIADAVAQTKLGGAVVKARFPRLASCPPCTRAINFRDRKKPSLSR